MRLCCLPALCAVLPLTKQLSVVSGSLWGKTLQGARAQRIEMLLLHEFHERKFILPDKLTARDKAAAAAAADRKKARKGGQAGGKGKKGGGAGDGEEQVGVIESQSDFMGRTGLLEATGSLAV